MKSIDHRTLYSSIESQQPSTPNSYDNLPEDQNAALSGMNVVSPAHTFRLHKIYEILKILDTERDKRSSLAKKYQWGINVLTGLSYRCEVATISLGTAGVALLSTASATPVVHTYIIYLPNTHK
jgi:hypothetical protein